MRVPLKIALVGPSAVGKDTLAGYLVSRYGFTHISTGTLLREYIQEHALGEPNRETLRTIAIEIRQTLGADYLVRQALASTSDRLVVSGIRAVPEIESFKKAGGVVIGIIAPISMRYELAKKRGDIADKLSFESFKRMEEIEDVGGDPLAPNVQGVLRYADQTIKNDCTLADLFRKMDDSLLIC